jgi:2-polyprenyl-6-methoxyphenol hydroxylase-like FAD-dependent oxidoreductase
MDVETDVAIVGAGPSGLALSFLLARSGVRSVLVERRQTRSGHPRAHFVNTRTMELFTIWGMVDEVKADAFPRECLPFALIEELGGAGIAARKQLSPALVASCAQDRVEEVILRHVENERDVRLLWDHRYREHQVVGDRIHVTVDGESESSSISARFLVGADGANSAVRQALGVEMVGDHDLGHVINMYFYGRITPEGEDPSMVMLAPNYGEVPGAFICMDGDRRWCFHLNYDPSEESVTDYTPERCADLIRRASNATSETAIEIQSVRPWTMTAHVAERMRVGNVFLVGDAAHAFPPTGGFGMNSGIQDAHNLAWKLASVLQSNSGESLLASYEMERQPVAYFNSAQSLRNARTSRRSPESPEVEAELDRRSTKSVRSGQLTATDDKERSTLEILEHASALGQEIGFAYDDSPVVINDGTQRPDIQVHVYIPNACPGARAPHAVFIQNGKERSLLEAYEGKMSLVTLPGGAAWRDAAALRSAGEELQLVTVGEGQPFEMDEGEFAALYGLGASGVVLVRPDGHVAFRSAQAGPNASKELEKALAVASGH